jgi:hypothetical protein
VRNPLHLDSRSDQTHNEPPLEEDFMRPSPLPARTPAKLSESVHQRLNMYALAAGAAGVGVLALSQPAGAKIVYTPAHRVIGPHQSYKIDLNHDKITDFTISNFATCGTDQCVYALFQKPRAGNSAVGYNFNSGLMLESALKPGARIGPGGHFQKGTGALVEAVFSSGGLSTNVFGPWPNMKDRYLGLKFQIKGKTHYGWARLSVQVSKTTITSTLTGYAYETIPNKPIIAGKENGTDDSPALNTESLATPASAPATLGMLATGARGPSVWRREGSPRVASEND